LSGDRIEAHLQDLRDEMHNLRLSIEGAVHVCHQVQTFEQLNTRLGNIESQNAQLLRASGRSKLLEKILLMILSLLAGGGGGAAAVTALGAHSVQQIAAQRAPGPGGQTIP
jgi:hypothetical protein